MRHRAARNPRPTEERRRARRPGRRWFSSVDPDAEGANSPARARIETVTLLVAALLHLPGAITAGVRADVVAAVPVVVAFLLWSGLFATTARGLRDGRRLGRGILATALALDVVLLVLSGLAPPRIGNLTTAALGLLALCAAGALFVPVRLLGIVLVPAVIGQVLLLRAADVGAGVGRFAGDVAGTVLVTVSVTAVIAWLGHERARATADLQRLAAIDPLTGLLNRRGLEAAFRRLTTPEADDPALPVVAVVVLDVDHFKSVNDRLGHAAGDTVLVSIAHTLREVSRADDALVRLGGEEMAWLARWPSERHVVTAADRLREAIARTTAADSEAVTVSLGIAVHPDPNPDAANGNASPGMTGIEDDLFRLIDRADRALYRAKAEGRDRVAVAPPARVR